VLRKLAFPYSGHPSGDIFNCAGIAEAPKLEPPIDSLCCALVSAPPSLLPCAERRLSLRVSLALPCSDSPRHLR